MKAKLLYWMQWLRDGAVLVMRGYPVELMMILYGCVGAILVYEMDWSDSCNTRFVLAPLFATLALVVNNLVGRGPWRKLYWACWAPIIPLSLWGGLADWLASPQGVITCLVLLPLAVLACRKAVRNERFVRDLIVWIRSGVLALLFANVTLGLFAAILYSTTYIFGLEGRWIEHVFIYALILCETLAVPVLFLMMSDRWRGAECTGNRIIDVLLNYMVTPALLVYTGILYLYLVKIVALWALPRGGVAYLVFGFTLMALAVKALQFLLQKRVYDWFFDRFSLIALPMQVLFWAGVVQRTSEYGLTQPRVWLLVCGGLMTLCVLLFLSRRAGRYLYVCLAALVVFTTMAYVPSLGAERIAVRSQTRRAVLAAERLGMLDAAGKLQLGLLDSADTTQLGDLHRLYESLDYIERRDTVAFAAFGIREMSDITDRLPQRFRDCVVYGEEYGICGDDDRNYFSIAASCGRRIDNLGRFKALYTNLSMYDDEVFPNYSFSHDTLRIDFGGEHPAFTLPGGKLLQIQLQKIGVENPDEKTLEGAEREFLTFDDGELQILFSRLSFLRNDGALELNDISIDAILVR